MTRPRAATPPSAAPRLWKCRSRGNPKPISTGPWKSRTDREIPTFPQPLLLSSSPKNGEEQNPIPVTPQPLGHPPWLDITAAPRAR
jgi:hypothetical protein